MLYRKDAELAECELFFLSAERTKSKDPILEKAQKASMVNITLDSYLSAFFSLRGKRFIACSTFQW
jgi:hypothetical protein